MDPGPRLLLQATGAVAGPAHLDLEAASRTGAGDNARVLSCLAGAYQVAASMLVKVDDHGAAWVAADQAIHAGERCDDLRLILAVSFVWPTHCWTPDRALAGNVLKQAVLMANESKGQTTRA